MCDCIPALHQFGGCRCAWNSLHDGFSPATGDLLQCWVSRSKWNGWKRRWRAPGFYRGSVGYKYRAFAATGRHRTTSTSNGGADHRTQAGQREREYGSDRTPISGRGSSLSTTGDWDERPFVAQTPALFSHCPPTAITSSAVAVSALFLAGPQPVPRLSLQVTASGVERGR